MHSALMSNYRRFDLAFERGEGPYLFSHDGRRYLDFAAGIAVAALGHCHPHLVAALQRQAERLWHCSNLYNVPEQERLAERLVGATFADRVLFSNSGAEAVECALKLVRKYHDDTGHPERYRVIACAGAFHGRTLATIAAGGSPRHLEGFAPAVDGFDHVAFGNVDQVRAAVTRETGAILVEPVQGEGGVRAASDAFLIGLREVADECGLLLIFDEVQCGMGRTGKLFAHEWAGVTPDVMAVAKGLGGGFPIGACLATEAAAAALSPGSHGSTFGGNPLAMAVGNAVLDVMLAEGFLESVQEAARHLDRHVTALAASYPQQITELRGRGLMRGLKLSSDVRPFVAQLMELGLLVVPAAEDVVRLVPPLIIGEQQVVEAAGILDTACAQLGDKAA
ncbi:MAG: aspartate aminotransferase family protein [Rhodospirillales bacterium]|nr:aspartate aminotransferase family protein [Rhodospirillales bacterium]